MIGILVIFSRFFYFIAPIPERNSPGQKGQIYCGMPEGRGLHQTAIPPSSDETRSINPLVHEQVD